MARKAALCFHYVSNRHRSLLISMNGVNVSNCMCKHAKLIQEFTMNDLPWHSKQHLGKEQNTVLNMRTSKASYPSSCPWAICMFKHKRVNWATWHALQGHIQAQAKLAETKIAFFLFQSWEPALIVSATWTSLAKSQHFKQAVNANGLSATTSWQSCVPVRVRTYKKTL